MQRQFVLKLRILAAYMQWSFNYDYAVGKFQNSKTLAAYMQWILFG
jgi:hypothetical protein